VKKRHWKKDSVGTEKADLTIRRDALREGLSWQTMAAMAMKATTRVGMVWPKVKCHRGDKNNGTGRAFLLCQGNSDVSLFRYGKGMAV
jgi:hypothetical protein